MKDRIARLCWNSYGWQKPSGAAGKSKGQDTYEADIGFGHEEWLFDLTKVVDGHHYAYLTAIAKRHESYVDQHFNISFYSINMQTNERWWVGEVKDAQVVNVPESRRVYQVYRKNGWLDDMEAQLRAVGVGDEGVQSLRRQVDFFAVIKFRIRNASRLESPLRFSARDPAVPSSRYSVLLNLRQRPAVIARSTDFVFSSGHNPGKEQTTSSYETQNVQVDRVQNRIVTSVYKQLAKQYGEKNVGTELSTGSGSKIDMVVRWPNRSSYTFFEVKTGYCLRLCIREALGQLLEYAFFPTDHKAKKLVIISTHPITPDAQKYLRFLRQRFRLPIYYQRYNADKEALDATEY